MKYLVVIGKGPTSYGAVFLDRPTFGRFVCDDK